MKKYVPLILLLLVILSGQLSEQAPAVFVPFFLMAVVALPRQMFWQVVELNTKNPFVESFKAFYILISFFPALVGTVISPYDRKYL